MGILTTGVSSSERARRQLLAKEILKLLQSKAKSGTQLKTQALLEMVQAQSQVVSYMHGELFVLKKIMPHFQLMTLWKTYCIEKSVTFSRALLCRNSVMSC